jgi:phosphatidylinositol glycan class B
MHFIAQRRVWFGLLLTSHLLAVLCSRGYFQFDEHYQVLEFIQWKFRLVRAADMPWELGARMRPWLHPLWFFPVEWLSHTALQLSPFVKTACHRALVAGLALYVIARRTRRSPQQLPLYATWFFYPFLDARISSEVIGGWLFALADSVDEDQEGESSAAATLGCGLLLGLAAVIRLHVLAFIFGLLVHHLRRRALRRCLFLVTGMLAAFGLGALCDYWGYGTFTFVPWNYVYQNIVLGKAVRFGTGASPWYWYAPALLRSTGYLPGLILIIALISHWLRKPLDRLSLITLPFVLLHLGVAHKELRYLFPLAPLMPALLLELWGTYQRLRLARVLAVCCMIINLVLLLPAAVHDADPDVSLYSALAQLPAPRGRTLYYAAGTNPLAPWHLYPSYYVAELGFSGRRAQSPLQTVHGLLCMDGLERYAELQRVGRCQLLASRYAASIMDHWSSWLSEQLGSRFRLWSLWRCP